MSGPAVNQIASCVGRGVPLWQFCKWMFSLDMLLYIVYEITVVMRALLGSDSGIDSVVVAVIHDSIRDYVITVGISPMSGLSRWGKVHSA